MTKVNSLSELKTVESDYKNTAVELNQYRKQYYEVQELYKDDSVRLLAQLQKLDYILDSLKKQASMLYSKIEELCKAIGVSKQYRLMMLLEVTEC